jgi:hypothetical protein
MIQTILIIWFFLTLPIVYQVNKSLKNTKDEWVSESFMFQITLIIKAFFKVPQYYILTIIMLFKK